MFEFTFKMFSEGSATLPAKGMEEIPRQLASRLPDNTLRLNTKVVAINGTEQIANLKLPATKWRSVTNCYFAAPHSPLREPIIALSGNPNSLINNVSVPSDLSADYAPTGLSQFLSLESTMQRIF